MTVYDLGYQIDGMGSRASFCGTWRWNSYQIATPGLALNLVNISVFNRFTMLTFFLCQKESFGT